MLRKPIDAPNNAILLRRNWQYDININITCRVRKCCGRSKRASPVMRELTLTYSSYVEHPYQRLSLAIAAHLDLLIYVGDAYDAFTHIPGPSVITLVFIDDQFSYWYRNKLGKILIGTRYFLY